MFLEKSLRILLSLPCLSKSKIFISVIIINCMKKRFGKLKVATIEDEQLLYTLKANVTTVAGEKGALAMDEINHLNIIMVRTCI